MGKYEFIEHTADIAIRVRAPDLAALFKTAASAMFEIASEKTPSKDKLSHKININQKAGTLEELLVNWLNELLSLSAVEGLIFEEFQINTIDEGQIQAIALGRDIKNFRMNTEIKAATYHELKIEKTASGWLAEIIFDV